MRKKELLLAGWLAIITGILDVPLSALAFVSGISKQAEIDITFSITNILTSGMLVYVFFLLKKLLNKGFSFSAVNVYIDIFIVFIISVTSQYLYCRKKL